MAQLGRLLQFDDARGYGFIAPDDGGTDVFVHANELQTNGARFVPGTRVEFEVMDGERGRKAFAVRLAIEAEGDVARVNSVSLAPAHHAATDDDDGMCDVLTGPELRGELTEVLLASLPELTGAQIIRLRSDFERLAQKHGWVED